MRVIIKSFIISILISLFVGGLSAVATMGNMNIYRDIITPPLSPPSFLFPIVWTLLFILMGVSSGIIYNEENTDNRTKESALFTYTLSLFVNFFWSIIFFNFKAFFLAFLWLILLLFLIIRTVIKYYEINKLAAYLQVPYLLWVTFAGYLSAAIWILNK